MQSGGVCFGVSNPLGYNQEETPTHHNTFGILTKDFPPSLNSNMCTTSAPLLNIQFQNPSDLDR